MNCFKIQNTNTNTYDPFSFDVSALTNDIITLPTVNGYVTNCIIDWGDGVRTSAITYNSPGCTHTYSLAGTYTINIMGNFESFSIINNTSNNLKTKLIRVNSWEILILKY